VLNRAENEPSGRASRGSRFRRFVALTVSAALVGGALSFFAVASPTAPTEPALAAPPASAFDPGFIISDSVMFDFGAMSVASIQSFLNSKVATCKATASVPCLKDYTTDTRTIAAVANRCPGDIVAKSKQSAAEVIFAVSVACRVNPKVLLVTLQKEQGLVTTTSPTASKYRIAMGYGCPDTAPCDTAYYGFFNQVYQAAYAYNKYVKSPAQYTAYQPGTRTIKYHPNSSCGTKTVEVRNKATAALYFYTPYTPNAASLNNPYATGDACSSYGNRNFWLYFSDWFGSPTAGSFLVDTADGSKYALIGGSKWRIPADRAGFMTTLAPLGKVARVSARYLANFPTAGDLGNLVVSPSGTYFVLDNGRKYSVATCAKAHSMGFPCAAAARLPADVLSLFRSAGELSTAVTTSDGARYVLAGGARREVLDNASAAAAGLSLPASSSVLADTVSRVPFGAPYTRPNVLIALRGSDVQYYATAARSYKIGAALLRETGVGARLGGTAGSLDAGSMAFLPGQVAFRGLFTDASTGASFVLTSAGKARVSDPHEWGSAFVPVEAGFSSLLPTASKVFSAPLFLKDQSTSKMYFLTDGQRRSVNSKSQVKKLASAFDVTYALPSLSGGIVPSIGVSGTPMLEPGSVVKTSKTSTTMWLIDGSNTKQRISSRTAKEVTGSSSAILVAESTLAAYRTRSGFAKLGLSTRSAYYVADGGVLRKVSPSTAKQFGKAFGFGSYSASTVRGLDRGAAMGSLIRYQNVYYEVKNGKKIALSRSTYLKKAKSSGKKAQSVDAYFHKLLPTK
jgi:hypothetical protein